MAIRPNIVTLVTLKSTILSMGVDFYSTLGGPLIEAPKAPRSNAEGVRIKAP